MNRRTGMLAALATVLVIVLFYLFLWSPRSDEIEELEAEIETVEQQQAQLERRIQELREVRNNAPDHEADIVAAESIVPRDVSQAAAIRQLQVAADGSGVELPSVTFGRPAQLADAEPGLASLQVTVQILGGYYEIVDFYRRVEDPTLTPRGITWASFDLAPEEHPDLTATATGAMYALLPTPPAPEPAEEAPAEDGNGQDDTGEEIVEEDAG